MHELGHDLGLVHSAADIIDDPYVDTTGVVSHGFAILLLLDLQKIASQPNIGFVVDLADLGL